VKSIIEEEKVSPKKVKGKKNNLMDEEDLELDERTIKRNIKKNKPQIEEEEKEKMEFDDEPTMKRKKKKVINDI
jgi:hypothetical protein